MTKYEQAFKKADEFFKTNKSHTQDRIRRFLHIVGDTSENRTEYKKIVTRRSALKFYYSNKKHCNERMRLYQKCEKYRTYRKKYESEYRKNNKLVVNYNSWRCTTKPSPMQEINYLLKRFLKEKL